MYAHNISAPREPRRVESPNNPRLTSPHNRSFQRHSHCGEWQRERRREGPAFGGLNAEPQSSKVVVGRRVSTLDDVTDREIGTASTPRGND